MCQSVQLAGVVCLVRVKTCSRVAMTLLSHRARPCEKGTGKEEWMQILAAEVISATLHIDKQDAGRCLHSSHIQSCPLQNLNLLIQVQPGRVPGRRLPRSEPRPLSSRLHFALSALSLCLITRRSMLTVNLFVGWRGIRRLNLFWIPSP